MVEPKINQIEATLHQSLQGYSPDVQKKIAIQQNGDDSLTIETHFGAPHLDIFVEVEGNGFAVGLSNQNTSEHLYGSRASAGEIAADLAKLLQELLTNGAVQTDKVRKNKVFSTNVRIGTSLNTTKILGWSILPKQQKLRRFPPVVHNKS